MKLITAIVKPFKLDSNQCRTGARVPLFQRSSLGLFADSLPRTDGRGPDSSLSSNGKVQVKAECFDGVPLQACLLTLTNASVSTSPGLRSSPGC